MAYKIKIIRKNEQKTTTWYGGTTTQLYIYPEDSVYSELNFKYRISSAMVLVEESTFTHLPGIDRKIMILDGELLLKHEDKYSVNLHKFGKDSFKGEFNTKSYGKVRDFNLMTTDDCEGDISHISIEPDEFKKFKIGDMKDDYNNVSHVYYPINADIDIEFSSDFKEKVHEGDLLIITKERNDKDETLYIYSKNNEKIDVIESIIYYK